MNRFKKIKILVLLVLLSVFVISLSFYLIFYMYARPVAMILIMAGILLIDLPLYYLYIFIEKTENKLRNAIKAVSGEIGHINDESADKIREFKGFENIAQSLEDANEASKRDLKTNAILNEILICAARNLELDKFIDSVLDKMMEIISSDWAVFYLLNRVTNKLEIKASKGFSKYIYSEYDITIGEGFIGNAAAKNEVKIINDLPDDTVFVISTFLGKIKPKSLAVVPICDENNEILGVFAAASLYQYSQEHRELLDKIKLYISYAIENGNYYNKAQRVARELKFQNQLIQNLNDDLEDRIKERTLFLNSIINSIKDTAIISVDSSNLITTFNKTAETMLDFSYDEVKGRNIRYIAENKPEFESRLLENINAASKNRTSYDFFDIINKKGRRYSVNMQVFVMNNEDGSSDGATIVMKDISEINKIINNATADKRLMTVLFKNSATSLIITNGKGEITDINKTAMRSLKASSYDSVISRGIHIYFEQPEKIAEFIKRVSDSDAKEEIRATLAKTHIEVVVLAYPVKNDFTGEIKILISIK